jgi:DNA-binding CsgD family transcriptional regulator
LNRNENAGFSIAPVRATLIAMKRLKRLWKQMGGSTLARVTVLPVVLYGVLIALGAAALSWLDLQRLARALPGEVHIGLVAAAFLTLGVWMGARLFGAVPVPPPGNPQAAETLGLTAREREILDLLNTGLTNKEMAARLNVSPNTIKTHLAHLFEKLGAKRRTEALARAREMNLLG